VDFEFDPDKSASNQLKHGIDFKEAQDLWLVQAVVVRSDWGAEPRYARIARHRDGDLWTSIYTHRGTTIRILSVWKASRSDRKLYEEHIS
jgi:uncharacterized protein